MLLIMLILIFYVIIRFLKYYKIITNDLFHKISFILNKNVKVSQRVQKIALELKK